MSTRKKPTQKELVLEYIKQFGSITAMQAFSDLGITHLNGRIKELRDEGIKIRTDMHKRENRYGVKVEYGVFSLEEPHQEGEQLDIFSCM